MSGTMRSLMVVVVVGFTVLSGRADAQTCLQMVNDMRSQLLLPNTGIAITVTSSQANKISTSSGREPFGGAARVWWDPGYLPGGALSTGSGVYAGANAGSMQFSDRNNTNYVSGAAQNFSTQAPHLEGFELHIFNNGTQARIHNRMWGYDIDIPALTCSDGLMYGFGSPIGNWNGGLSAMYVFSYYSYLYIN